MDRRYLQQYTFAHPRLGLEIRTDVQLREESFPVHTHDFSELVLITGGAGTHVVGQQSYRVRAGDAFVTSGSRAHGYKDAAGMVRQIVMFDPRRLPPQRELYRDLPGFHAMFVLEEQYRASHRFQSRLTLDAPALRAAVGMIRQMAEEVQSRQPGYAAAAWAGFSQLVVFLSRQYTLRPSESSGALLQLAGVISYIDEHYASPITLDELACRAGLSRNRFIAAFKRATGHTPIDHLLRARVSAAVRLLSETELSITRLALDAGFTDSNYFARQFRRIMGVTPRSYRAAARRGNGGEGDRASS